MSGRPLLPRVLVAAAVLAVVPATGGARAQAVDLRGTDTQAGVDGFPTSPTDSPVSPPEQNTPPSTEASPAAADDQTPAAQPDQNQPDDGAPNYGKPRQRKPNLYRLKPKLYKPPAETGVPLAPLQPYRVPSKQRRQPEPAPSSSLDATGPTQPPPTVAALPTPQPLRRRVDEDDPFAPLGVRAGDLILKPFVETSAGYESNPNQVTTGVKSSPALRVDGGLDLSSDFSSSSLTGNLRGGYSEFPSNSNANRPDLSATIDGRIDVTRTDTIDTEARLTLATQTPGSPLLAVPNAVFVTSRPTIISEGATLGGTHLLGSLSLGLKGTFDRTQYGDATQSNGTILPYSQENYNDYGAVARASYEVTPAIIPFTEIGVDSRVHDSFVDFSGYERDSIGGTARAGVTFDVIGYFTGNASAGYLDRHYDDPRLPNLRGPTLDGTLVYAATPLTTVTLRASTTASETTLAGASGAISRSFSAEIAHVFFRNFTLSGIATYQPNDYQGVSGSERYTTLTLKGAYNVTRDIQLIASASHETLTSTFIGEGFKDDIFLAGVRLQR